MPVRFFILVFPYRVSRYGSLFGDAELLERFLLLLFLVDLVGFLGFLLVFLLLGLLGGGGGFLAVLEDLVLEFLVGRVLEFPGEFVSEGVEAGLESLAVDGTFAEHDRERLDDVLLGQTLFLLLGNDLVEFLLCHAFNSFKCRISN